MTALRLGTRGSALALAQSTQVADAIGEILSVEVELVTIRSLGDDLVGPLSQAPQPGVFVSALRDALLSGDVDVVVHSMKDLPAAAMEGISIVAVPQREEPWDALITSARCTLADLPSGAVVGTSSPRRAGQLRHRRPDLSIVDLRGNIDTRIQRVRSGDIDAAILAVAGLRRIGREDEIDEMLTDFVPAPAQGALAVEARSADEALVSSLIVLDNATARRQATAERAVLHGLSATCTSAVAALINESDSEPDALVLDAEVGASGQRDLAPVRAQMGSVVPAGDDDAAGDLGEALARLLLASGAGELLSDGSWSAPGDSRPLVWLTRPASGARADARALRDHGLAVLEAPVLRVDADPAAREAAQRSMHAIEHTADLLAITSAAALRALADLVGDETVRAGVASGQARGLRIAAVGNGTAEKLRDFGAKDVLVPTVQDSEAMLAMLGDDTPGQVVLPRGNLAMAGLAEGLQSRGWEVLTEQVYVTGPVPAPLGIVEAVAEGIISAIVLRSPSGVRATRDALGEVRLPSGCLLIAGGPTTAASIEKDWPAHGGQVVLAEAPNPDAVAQAVARACGIVT